MEDKSEAALHGGHPYPRQSAFIRGRCFTFAALREFFLLCLFAAILPGSIRGAVGVDDGAAHVAGFYGLMHEVVEIGGVFPGLKTAFFDQFGAQFADAIREGLVPPDIIGGYILDGVELPAGFIQQSADGRWDYWVPTK
jgi:hypothetical protein